MATKNTMTAADPVAVPPLIPSKRFTMALLVLMAFIVQYAQRVNLPISIICMVNRNITSPKIRIDDNLTFDQKQSYQEATSTQISQNSHYNKAGFLEEKKFDWSELEQQLLLGSYWAGYIFTQVPGKTAIDLVQELNKAHKPLRHSDTNQRNESNVVLEYT